MKNLLSLSHLAPLAGALALATTLGVGQLAHAQQKEVAPEALRKKTVEAKVDDKGWQYGLKLGASASFQHNSGVVGQVDGMNFTFGLNLDGHLYYVSQVHQWENELKLVNGWTKTPTLDAFVKSADALDFSSLYMFRIKSVPWLGPYARFRLSTALFNGYDVRPDDTTYVLTHRDGTTETRSVPGQQEEKLTSGGEPFLLVESVGVFANPIEKKVITVKLKLGAGAQHTITSDGYAIDDNKDTPEVELKQLDTIHQGGVEFEVALNGAIAKPVTWNAKANFFLPFIASSGDTGFTAMSTDISGGLSIKLASWASLDYVLSAKRIPSVSKTWQIQNGLLFTSGFNLL